MKKKPHVTYLRLTNISEIHKDWQKINLSYRGFPKYLFS